MTLHISDIKSDAQVGSRVDLGFSVPRTGSIYRKFAKRAFDVLSIILFLPIVGPLIALMALIVALDGKNPFYSQLRIGKNGRQFRLWKIRTMTSDADERLECYLQSNPEAQAEWNLHQKLKHDPRITVVGKFLRKASLDELPQLLNVLTGSMSLVGPRPMMLDQEQFYYGSAYYRVHPGITGSWQISDRNQCSFVSRVKFDEAYEKDISFVNDFKILLKTVAVVFRGTGY